VSKADKPGGGGKGGIVALGLLTLVAAGAGAAHGLQTFKSLGSSTPGKGEQPVPAVAHAPAAGHGEPAAAKGTEKAKLPSKIVTRSLQPLITNILMPADVWVRLEGAIVYDQADVEDPEMMLTEVSGDLLAYLRSLTLRELQGTDGLMFVRQDMKERIVLRTKGKARDIIIQTLVMQ
jgi:flagellar FliL protein